MKATTAITVLVCALILPACVSTHMKQYLGRDIREVMIDSGPPVNAFDMPDRTRAFQFYWGGGEFPVPQTTTASVNVFGNAAYLNSMTIGGGVVSSKGCLITYFARHDEKGGAWTVVDISYPKRLFC